MEFDHFPRTRPDALAAIRAALVDNVNVRLHQLDGVFRAHTDTATAKVAFAGNDINHQWRVSWHKARAMSSEWRNGYKIGTDRLKRNEGGRGETGSTRLRREEFGRIDSFELIKQFLMALNKGKGILPALGSIF